MHSNNKHKNRNQYKIVRSAGFTLVELLVVIGVIAIILSILALTLVGQQENNRDTTRNTKATVLSEALEKYYDKNGEYPSVPSLAGQTAASVSQKLSITDKDLLIFPGATSSTQASIASPSTTPSPKVLVYAGTADGTANTQCQNDANGYCAKYQLRYQKEGTNEVVTIDSRRNPYVKNEALCSGSDCLGAPSKPTVVGTNLNSTTVRFTAGSATCAVGSVQYQIRYNSQSASESDMPLWSSGTWSASTTLDVSKADASNFYSQSRAQCVSGSDGGPASANSNVHSLNLTPAPNPSAVAVTGSTSAIRLTWPDVPGATSYSVTGAGNASSCTTSGCTVSGLNASTYYSFNVFAVSSSGTSSPGTAGTTTNSPVACNAPSNPSLSASANSSSSVSLSWSASTGDAPMNYYIYYGTSSSAGTYYATTSGTSMNVTGLSTGTTYYFKMYAANNCSSSSWSSTVSATTSADAPATPQVSVSGGSTSTWSWPAVSCSVGTTQYEYNYSSNLGGSQVGTTNSTSVSFTTNSEGITYTTEVRARCVNGSTVSAYSGKDSKSYKHPMTSYIIASSGYVRLVTATFAGGTGANKIWGQGFVQGVNGSCPSGTTGYIQYINELNQNLVGYSDPFGTFGSSPEVWSGYYAATYYSALSQGDMLEFKYRSWCRNNTTGELGPYARSDIYGNLHLDIARNQNTNTRGTWRRGCGGYFASPYTADACTPIDAQQFAGF